VASLSPAPSAIPVCLSFSAVWSQLPDFSLSWQAGSPGFQDGLLFPRIHTHPLPSVGYSYYLSVNSYHLWVTLKTEEYSQCTIYTLTEYCKVWTKYQELGKINAIILPDFDIVTINVIVWLDGSIDINVSCCHQLTEKFMSKLGIPFSTFGVISWLDDNIDVKTWYFNWW
jgi:hypothetical protein